MKHKDELLLAAVFAYVKETYGVEPDYPFAKEPDMPVLRHRDTRKWFGIIQSVAREKLGLPPEIAALLLLRPLSGSAALAAGAELMERCGADSLAGRTAAVLLGGTETTFYVVRCRDGV